MKERVFASIIMPVFNVEKHIERAIESCLSQTDLDFEVIIVDDCGKDASIDIAKAYEEKEEKIRIIRNEKNLGTFHSRWAGVKASSGEMIVFLDPDDELMRNAVELIKKSYLESQSDIILCGVRFLPEREWYKKKPFLFFENNKNSALRSIYSRSSREFLWGGTPGKVYKSTFLKDHLERVGKDIDFRFVFMEDNYLFYTAVVACQKYKNLYNDIYIYYKNSSSITMTDESTKMKFNVEQYRLFIKYLSESCVRCFPTKSESLLLKKLVDYHEANLCLISRRMSCNSYPGCVFSSFLLDPKVRKIAALATYYMSFGKLRF